MLTGKKGRPVQFPYLAAKCFHNQTYENKHLVLINHGEERLNIPGVSEFMITREKRLQKVDVPLCVTMGEMRQFGVNVIKRMDSDAIITIWDDDDWYEPSYITSVMEHWKDGHMINWKQQIVHDLRSNTTWRKNYKRVGVYGQVTFPANCTHQYFPINKNEDVTFKKKFQHAGQLITFENDPCFYLRVVHGTNFWGSDAIMEGRNDPDCSYNLLPDQIEFVNRVRKHYQWFLDMKDTPNEG
jgi:hypothetical protein